MLSWYTALMQTDNWIGGKPLRERSPEDFRMLEVAGLLLDRSENFDNMLVMISKGTLNLTVDSTNRFGIKSVMKGTANKNLWQDRKSSERI